MSKKSTNQEFYDKLYKSKNVLLKLLHTSISYDQQSKANENYRLIKDMFGGDNNNIKILDYGFGHGAFLLKMPKDALLYGCEISVEAINNMQKIGALLNRNITLCLIDEYADKFKNLKFDLICCSHVLEHVENDILLVEQLCEKIKKGGKLLINLPINEVWNDPKHVKKYSKNSAIKLLNNHGLQIEKVVEANKWSAFLLHYEQNVLKGKRIIKIFRFIRLILAMLPLSLIEFTEQIMLKKYPYQFLIVLARKDD